MRSTPTTRCYLTEVRSVRVDNVQLVSSAPVRGENELTSIRRPGSVEVYRATLANFLLIADRAGNSGGTGRIIGHDNVEVVVSPFGKPRPLAYRTFAKTNFLSVG